MKQQLYMISIVAMHPNGGGFAYNVAAAMAISVEEAVGKGIAAAKMLWPHHHNHSAVASLIPKEMIIAGFNALAENQENVINAS